MNSKKLKGALIESGMTYIDIAKLLKISVTSVNNKVNGKTEFTCSEISLLAKWLKLSNDKSAEIFFN